MAYTDDDKEYLKLVIEGSINTAMKPVMEHIAENNLKLQKHEQQLNGVNGDNGLNGDVSNLKKDVKRFDAKLAWTAGVVTGISIAFSFFKSKILGG